MYLKVLSHSHLCHQNIQPRAGDFLNFDRSQSSLRKAQGIIPRGDPKVPPKRWNPEWEKQGGQRHSGEGEAPGDREGQALPEFRWVGERRQRRSHTTQGRGGERCQVPGLANCLGKCVLCPRAGRSSRRLQDQSGVIRITPQSIICTLCG